MKQNLTQAVAYPQGFENKSSKNHKFAVILISTLDSLWFGNNADGPSNLPEVD